MTGPQWVDKYLRPLSCTDLLADEIHCHARVTAVGRQHLLKHEPSPDEHRGDDGFRILVEHSTGRQTHELADIVIDCTGVYGDPIIANVGYRPDGSLYEELQVARSPVTGGPAGLGQHSADDSSDDDAGRTQLRPERLCTPEPNFYILGAKSCGRDSRFLMADGFRQIRDLFGVIGGRPELDLYATAEKLTK